MYLSPWIYTTNNCNLRCPYCFEEHTPEIMSEDIWMAICEKFIDMIQTGTLERTHFRIAGGEPLTCFYDWCEFIAYMKKTLGEQFSSVLITNMTLMNDKILRFCLEHDISITASLDGTIHSKVDTKGESTSKQVMEIIESVNRYTPVTILSVLNQSNTGTGEMLEMAKFIEKNHLYWSLNSDIFAMNGGDMADQMYEDIKEAFDYLLKSGYPKELFKFQFLTCEAKPFGCAAGLEMLSISTNGDIYPCHTCKGKPLANIQNCDDIIGTLHNQKLYNVGFNYKLPDVCHPDHCPASMLCYGSCKLNMNPSEDNPKCKLIKRLYQYLDSKEYFVGQVVN